MKRRSFFALIAGLFCFGVTTKSRGANIKAGRTYVTISEKWKANLVDWRWSFDTNNSPKCFTVTRIYKNGWSDEAMTSKEFEQFLEKVKSP